MIVSSQKVTLLLAFGLLCKHVNNKRIGLNITAAAAATTTTTITTIIIIIISKYLKF
jgi:hypothetical protein